MLRCCLVPLMVYGQYQQIIGTKSMQNNSSIQNAKTSGNPEVSQTHLAISFNIAFRKAIHLNE